MAEMTSTLKRFLKQANAKWQEEASRAKEDRGFGNLDDGRYVARVTAAEFTESKNSGKPMIVTTFEILEGDYQGESVKQFRVLDSENGFFWFAKEMMVFGYDPEDIHFDEKRGGDGFILNVLEAMSTERPAVKLRLTTKNDYQNVNVEGLVEGYEVADDEPKKTKETPKTSSPKESPKTAAKTKTPDPEPEEVEEVEEDEETEEIEEEEVELTVGMKVKFNWKGENLEGVVKEILEDDNKIKVKVGNKIYPVTADNESLEIVESEVDN